jgi:hypothetical protein
VVAGLALLPVASAGAETAADSSQLSVTGGSLSFNAAPNVPSMGTLTLNGEAQTLTAQLPNWSVSDATGSGSGWNVSVQGDSGEGKSAVFKEYCAVAEKCTVGYVAGGKALSANSLTLTSSGAAFGGLNETTGTGPTHSCASTCSVDSATAVKVAAAAEGTGMGTWQAETYGASSLQLAAPTTVEALGEGEVYRADLLWTLSSGP